jgi:hypothetical protein
MFSHIVVGYACLKCGLRSADGLGWCFGGGLGGGSLRRATEKWVKLGCEVLERMGFWDGCWR